VRVVTRLVFKRAQNNKLFGRPVLPCTVLGSCRASRGFGARTAEWVPGSAPGWPIPFFGFFLGSLLFTAQSLLMVHEIAENEEENARGRGAADAEVGDVRAGGRNRR